MERGEEILRHLEDLCRRAERTGRWFYSGFLSPAEQDDFSTLPVSRQTRWHFWGGMEAAERRILAAGDPEENDPAYPLKVIRISPVAPKFAEELSHRDYLGALLNLGIERSLIGDILVEGKDAWVFCLERAGEILCGELHRVRRTEVTAAEDPDCPALKPRLTPMTLNVSSERLDAVVAGFAGLSREKAAALITGEKVFVNSRPAVQRDARLKEGDILSVRGFGKAVYDGVDRTSRKGRLFLKLRRYG